MTKGLNMLSGSLEIRLASGNKKKFYYSFSEQKPSFSELLIPQFRKYKVKTKSLSFNDRKKLLTFKNINKKELQTFSNELANIILADDITCIIANDLGTFICLEILLSPKVETEKIEFVLEQAPFTLFPKEIKKNINALKKQKIKVIQGQENHWLNQHENLISEDKAQSKIFKVAA